MSTWKRALLVTWAARQISAKPGVSPWQKVPVEALVASMFSSGCKGFVDPVTKPVGDVVVSRSVKRPQGREDAQIVHRMNVAGDHLCKHPHAGAAKRVRG